MNVKTQSLVDIVEDQYALYDYMDCIGIEQFRNEMKELTRDFYVWENYITVSNKNYIWE